VRLTLSLLLLLAPSAVLAQAPADSCATGPISAIRIDNASIFDETDPDLDRRFRWAYRAANALHVRTRDWVIRRELLFQPGDCLDPFLVEESERLLRGYSFLSDVEIRSRAEVDGGQLVEVDTRDDWSTRVDVRFGSSLKLEGLRLTEENVLGSGQSLGVFFVGRDVQREYGASYYTPQLLGTRWDLRLEAGKTRPGSFVRQEVAYPYVGEVSHWAGRQSFVREDRYFDYITADDPELRAGHILLPVREKLFDVALVRRIGQPGNMALLGAALTYQELAYPGEPLVAPEGRYADRFPADDSTRALLRPHAQQLDNIRAFLLVGHRTVQWETRRGLNSMRGNEDVRLGAETGLAIGRSLSALENDDDLFGTISLYGGVGAGDALFFMRARVDSRRDLNAPVGVSEWEDVYAEGELLAYLKPRRYSRHTLVARAAGLGAWHTRTPFQLTLGGDRALRGYDPERFPGGRRLVLNLEDRVYFGWPLRGVMDVGGTVFGDAGRIWKGDVPFGFSSDWRASAGLGLRVSFPAGGRSVYRVDIAWPIEQGTRLGDFRLMMSLGESISLYPRNEDQQLTRSRPAGVAGELFPFHR
jgi:hypothetical protein